MPQFFVSPENIDAGRFRIDGDEAHHLLKVHRARAGDVLRVFDGAGRRFRARVDSAAGTALSGTLLEEFPEAVPPFQLTLHVAALPRARYEEVIERGTELGVAAFQTVTTLRDVAKAGGKEERRERWRALALAAAKQCLRARLPEFLPTATLEQAMVSCPAGTGLLAWEGEKTARLRDLLPAPGELHLFIGPEGGFAAEDVARARVLGFRTFTLGENILRAETAALAAAAAVLVP